MPYGKSSCAKTKQFRRPLVSRCTTSLLFFARKCPTLYYRLRVGSSLVFENSAFSTHGKPGQVGIQPSAKPKVLLRPSADSPGAWAVQGPSLGRAGATQAPCRGRPWAVLGSIGHKCFVYNRNYKKAGWGAKDRGIGASETQKLLPQRTQRNTEEEQGSGK